MAAIRQCPPPETLHRLLESGGSADEIEGLAQHLEQCDACGKALEGLLASNTTVQALGSSTASDPPASPALTQLKKRLQMLQPAAEAGRARAWIRFPCPHCARELKCKPELAGKKVKCPGCGQAAPVPALAPAATEPESPGEISEQKTLLQVKGRDRTPPGPRGRPEPEKTTAEAEGEDKKLWDFLAPSEQPDEIGRLGPYRVLKMLGAGGMGVVFRAHDPQLDRLVALKAMLPTLATSASAKERFFREAKAAAALKHPHVVTIHQVGEDRGAPFLAMEFLEGESLDHYLKRKVKLPASELLRIGREIALGLAAAHDKGLIHRDIKPANVWLESVVSSPSSVGKKKKQDSTTDNGPRTMDYHVKILDFGLARAMGDQSNLTQSGTIIGTPAYMAPEQAGGKSVDHRCDLFSLGCVLYRMCTGQMAFKGPDTISILSALALEQPESPATLHPEIPAELSELVMQLLAKNPADRPSSAREVADRLQELEDSAEPSARAAKPKTRTRTPKERKRHLVLVAAACAAVVLVGVIAAVTVVRFGTGTGELVVQIDDPNVEVSIRQNNVVVQDKTTKREFELSAGDGVIEVYEKTSGLKLATKQFTLTRGGKTYVQVNLEEIQAARKLPGKKVSLRPGTIIPDKEKPFVLIRSGKDREEFKTLAGVLQALGKDDVIEVHGNGPFVYGSIRLDGKALNLRAGPGYRPRFVYLRSPERYFLSGNAPVSVEGCDFCIGGAFADVAGLLGGGGAPWEFRACRFLGGFRADLGGYTGPKLRFLDCLISIPSPFAGEPFGIGALPGKSVELEMTNCIIWIGGHYYFIEARGPGQMRFTNNTMMVNAPLLSLRHQPSPLTVVAERNVFQVMGIFTWEKSEKPFSWQGKDNLYVGPNALLQVVHDKRDKAKYQELRGLAQWNKFLGHEEPGAREADWAYFAWDEVRRHEVEEERAIEALKAMVEEARQRDAGGLKELGPQWSLVGSGAGYLRALAEGGKAVAKTDLRPEPLPVGPMVLWRGGKISRAYGSLEQATAAALDGDVIEVRSDGPFPGPRFQGKGKRIVTIRAGAGFRPTIDGRAEFDTTDLSLILEGLHFRKGGLLANADKDKNAILRLENCYFESQIDIADRHVGRFPRTGIAGLRFANHDGKPAEIVNCFIPGSVRGLLGTGDRLKIRNSVVGSLALLLGAQAEGESRLDLERSVIWNPCCGVPGIQAGPAAGAKFKGKLYISARGTLFEPGVTLVALGDKTEKVEISAWKGAGNLYRVGHRHWLTFPIHAQSSPIGLAQWRRHWHSDQDSVEGEPVDYQPHLWRLRPASPNAQKDGKNLGADLD
jgi:serine/threonine protein kinase